MAKTPTDLALPDSQTSSDLIAHLQEVALFSDIRNQPGAIESMAAIMTLRRIPAGEKILTEGAIANELLILIKGQASVYKLTPEGDEYKVAIFDGSKNVAIGESGLVDSDYRSATIRADTACECLVLGREQFEKYSNEYPHWALPVYRRIIQSVMARMKKTNNDMLLLYNALVAEIRGD